MMLSNEKIKLQKDEKFETTPISFWYVEAITAFKASKVAYDSIKEQERIRSEIITHKNEKKVIKSNFKQGNNNVNNNVNNPAEIVQVEKKNESKENNGTTETVKVKGEGSNGSFNCFKCEIVEINTVSRESENSNFSLKLGIGNQWYHALLDTGANVSLVHPKLIPKGTNLIGCNINIKSTFKNTINISKAAELKVRVETDDGNLESFKIPLQQKFKLNSLTWIPSITENNNKDNNSNINNNNNDNCKNEEENIKERIQSINNKFKDILVDEVADDFKPTIRDNYDMEIKVKEGSEPIKRNYGRRSEEEFKKLKEEVEKLLKKGIIEESNSDYATHVAQDNMVDAQVEQAIQYNKDREDIEYEEGEKIKIEYFQSCQEIVKIRLVNRKNGTRNIHVDDIKPYIEEDRIFFSKRNQAQHSQLKDEIQSIVDKRCRKYGTGSRIEYKVRYKFSNEDHDEWVPLRYLENCTELVKSFEEKLAKAEIPLENNFKKNQLII
ncbi:hypothetical protein ACTFIV_007844 [Dictyostelium citrinum]